jgi:hypothetical protein
MFPLDDLPPNQSPDKGAVGLVRTSLLLDSLSTSCASCDARHDWVDFDFSVGVVLFSNLDLFEDSSRHDLTINAQNDDRVAISCAFSAPCVSVELEHERTETVHLSADGGVKMSHRQVCPLPLDFFDSTLVGFHADGLAIIMSHSLTLLARFPAPPSPKINPVFSEAAPPVPLITPSMQAQRAASRAAAVAVDPPLFLAHCAFMPIASIFSIFDFSFENSLAHHVLSQPPTPPVVVAILHVALASASPLLLTRAVAWAAPLFGAALPSGAASALARQASRSFSSSCGSLIDFDRTGACLALAGAESFHDAVAAILSGHFLTNSISLNV